MQRENFGRNIRLVPKHYYEPTSEEEVLEIMSRHSKARFRVIGRLHSWSRILETDDVLFDLKHLKQVVTENRDDQALAQIGAGCQIKEVLSELSLQRNWTLPSLGFVTEQTIAGATATGTHGSGKNSLSHYIVSARIACFDPVSGKPMIREISSGDELRVIRCSLGCLGIVLSVTVQCRPDYQIEEVFRQYDSLEEVFSEESKFPLQQFYLIPWRWNYIAQHRREIDSKSSILKGLYHWYRFLVFDIAMHLLILLLVRLLRNAWAIRMSFRFIIPACVVKNWDVTGPAAEQLVMEHEMFRHLEIELFVQRSKLPAAIDFLVEFLKVADQGRGPSDEPNLPDHLSNNRYTHHYPICIRRIKCDDTLISMACPASQTEVDSVEDEEDWFAISLINYQRAAGRQAFLELAETLASTMQDKFAARVHWGKLNPLTPERLRTQYPQFKLFADIRASIDHSNQFCNDWLAELFESENNE